MRIGERVRAVHLSQYCPGGLGFPAGSPGTGQPADGDDPAGQSGRSSPATRRRPRAAGARAADGEISPGQPVRRRADHDWVHGDCR